MPLVVRRNGVCGIVNENEVSRLADLDERLHVTRYTRDMHGKDGSCARREFLEDLVRINVQRRRIDVDEDRLRAGVTYSFRGRGEGVRGGDHFVAFANAGGNQREVQCGGAGTYGKGVFCADVLGESPLELRRFGSRANPLGRQYFANGFYLVVANPRARKRL